MTNHAKLTDAVAKLRLATRGLHAADESGGNIAGKFKQLGVDNTPENRIAYRGALITTPRYGQIVGGVILFDETFRQSYEGKAVTSILEQQEVVIGVKVDAGLQAFGSSKVEQVGKNELAALPARLEEYAAKNVRFTKFRVVGNIGSENGKSLPTDECLAANAELLAGYAEACHNYGIVPIVEPEVPMEGSPHTLAQCQQASLRFLKATFAALDKKKIFLPGVILKTNMVLAGSNGPKSSEAEYVKETVSTLEATVPSNIGGVVFLSGGQSTEDGMARLSATRKAAHQKHLPFEISSSYSRALQGPALDEFGAAIRAGCNAAEIKKRTQAKFTETLEMNEKALKESAAN
jgi:fructose-bisphosphate aldolase class I